MSFHAMAGDSAFMGSESLKRLLRCLKDSDLLTLDVFQGL